MSGLSMYVNNRNSLKLTKKKKNRFLVTSSHHKHQCEFYVPFKLFQMSMNLLIMDNIYVTFDYINVMTYIQMVSENQLGTISSLLPPLDHNIKIQSPQKSEH